LSPLATSCAIPERGRGMVVIHLAMLRSGRIVANQTVMNHATFKHRRKRRARLLAEPTEQTSEYPGFFVLPRPDRRRIEAHQAAAIGLLVLGGFIAAVAFFFFDSVHWNDPVGQPAPFISDPKSLTNSDDGGFGRR
jgi:hypothetical protein